MKQKKRKQQVVFEGSELQVKLPRRDYSRMSERQLLHAGQRMYTDLQVLWRVELDLTSPDWQVLESVSRQLRTFEEHCPEVCEL